MELRDEVKSRFERSHKLAKKYYDAGKIKKARTEYMNCALLLEKLAELSPPERKSSILERSKRFREIAEGLKEGGIKVFTNGVVPQETAEPQTTRLDEEQKAKDKIKDLVLVEKPKVKFEDIAGLDEVKWRIKEAIVYPFTRSEEYKYFGVDPGDGILLYGPPGCGKTMLAAAAAAECDAVFINLKISEIKDKYVGESEKHIKYVFELARSYERAIMFFDEIDALGGERSNLSEGHEKSVVNELLAQMDGLEAKGSPRNSLVLAATNRPWDVDLGLRRSERFDTKVFIPHPDLAARQKLLEIKLRNKPLDITVSFTTLAQTTEGYASAEIASICKEAARIPLRERLREGKQRRKLTMDDFRKAIYEQESVLPSWYAKALKEIERSEETNMFAELVRVASRYKLPDKSRTKSA